MIPYFQFLAVVIVLVSIAIWATCGEPDDKREQMRATTKSTLNDKEYHVHEGQNATEAADLLAKTELSLNRIIRYVASDTNRPSYKELGRLVQRYKSGLTIPLAELTNKQDRGVIAYSENKTDGIYICLRTDFNSMQLGGNDVVLYIAIHELTHSITPDYANEKDGHTVHNDRFRAVESYLFHVAAKLHLLHPDNIPNRHHCGVCMPDPKYTL